MNSKRESPRVCILLLGTCLLWVSAAYSQSARRLEGRVLDESGGRISGATVTLYSDDRVRTMKADEEGKFVFVGLTAPVRYLEASSTGFFSRSVPITDSIPQPISLTLRVGRCSPCVTVFSVSDRAGYYQEPAVHYEDRTGREQLTGVVTESSGPLLPDTSLDLMKADVDTSDPSWHPSPAMKEGSFEYRFVVHAASNERGEFRFADLEPGWYSLDTFHVGYEREMAKFWIERETLTKLRIEMLPTNLLPFPFLPMREIPLASLPRLPHAASRKTESTASRR